MNRVVGQNLFSGFVEEGVECERGQKENNPGNSGNWFISFFKAIRCFKNN